VVKVKAMADFVQKKTPGAKKIKTSAVEKSKDCTEKK